jgi:type II secretory pathway predicted ATPase ExeA
LRGSSKSVVLILDDAHLMPDASLDDLRLLTADSIDKKRRLNRYCQPKLLCVD